MVKSPGVRRTPDDTAIPKPQLMRSRTARRIAGVCGWSCRVFRRGSDDRPRGVGRPDYRAVRHRIRRRRVSDRRGSASRRRPRQRSIRHPQRPKRDFAPSTPIPSAFQRRGQHLSQLYRTTKVGIQRGYISPSIAPRTIAPATPCPKFLHQLT